MTSTDLKCNRLTGIYQRFNSAPDVSSARLLSVDATNRNRYIVRSEWKTLDVVRRQHSGFFCTYLLSLDRELGSIKTEYISDPCLSTMGEGFSIPQENGLRILWSINAQVPGLRAVCVEYSQPTTSVELSRATRLCAPEAGFFVQIWLQGTLVNSIKLPTSGESARHGKLFSKSGLAFAGAVWSSDSKEIVYTAEAIANSEVDATDSELHSVFRHHEDWGEGLGDVHRTVLCLLDVKSGVVTCLVDETNLPGLSPSKPIWCPNSRAIVFLGYTLDAYRLGLKYCLQRPCQLFHLDIASRQCRALSDPTQAVYCPSFSPDGKYLVWLENPVGGPHRQCSALMALDWPPKEGIAPRNVVPRVDTPDSVTGFPGLFGDLSERCWSTDSRHIVLSSIWGFELVPIIIDIGCQSGDAESGSIRVIPVPPLRIGCCSERSACSVTVLDVYEDIVCASVKSIDVPPVLAIFSLQPWLQTKNGTTSQFDWLFISPCGLSSSVAKVRLSGVDCYPLDSELSSDTSFRRARSVLVCPRLSDSTKQLEPVDLIGDGSLELELAEPLIPPDRFRGLIVFPHGGPHSAFTASWSPMVAGCIASGFACLLINYRGSLGYGEAELRSILGQIGTNDVQDCVSATELALNRLKEIFNAVPPVVLFGGSHGGFLVLHLAARYPSLYRAVVARNPVTSLSSMADTSDIPDWCYTEAGLNETSTWPLSHVTGVKDFERFCMMSPINQLAPSWSAPLLLLLGAKDRRVPMSQGLLFYRKLKALCPEVPCEALILPNDGHPLDSPIAETATFVNTICWFDRHLKCTTAV